MVRCDTPLKTPAHHDVGTGTHLVPTPLHDRQSDGGHLLASLASLAETCPVLSPPQTPRDGKRTSMNIPNTRSQGPIAPDQSQWNWKDRFARKLVHRQFASLRHGQLSLIDPLGSV